MRKDLITFLITKFSDPAGPFKLLAMEQLNGPAGSENIVMRKVIRSILIKTAPI